MKVRTLFFVVLLAVACRPVGAQQRFDGSVFGGINMCQIDGDDAGGYSHLGLRAGVGTSFSLSADASSPLRMVVELAYAQKGSYVAQIDRNIYVDYVEMPLMLSYRLLDDRLRLAAGVAPAVLVHAEVTDAGVDNPVSVQNYRRFDALPLVASVRYLVGGHFAVEARWEDSMVSITKENGSGTYRLWRENRGAFNRLVTLGLAYQF